MRESRRQIRERKQKKKSRWKIALLSSLLVILLFTATAILLVKVFVVKNVKVEGNVLYEDELIVNTVLNDEYSWSSIYVLLKYTFMDTEPIPFIDEMEISMANPQTLNIKVYEKGIMGYLYIPSNEQKAFFDKDGFVVEIHTGNIPDIPCIMGLECNEIVLYEKLPIEESLLKKMLSLTQTLKREKLIPDTITYGVKNEPVVSYDKVKVLFGGMSNLTQKVERMKKILPELNGMAGTLHLENWTEENTNIVFEKEE